MVILDRKEDENLADLQREEPEMFILQILQCYCSSWEQIQSCVARDLSSCLSDPVLYKNL